MDENLQLLVSCQNFQANDTRQGTVAALLQIVGGDKLIIPFC